MDAPFHYHLTPDASLPGGAPPAMRIDEIPLDWCWGRGVKLDLRGIADGHVVGAAELARIGQRLAPLDIVLLNTAAGAAYGQPDYVDRGCGVGRDGTLYLAKRAVRVVGTDDEYFEPSTDLAGVVREVCIKP